HSSSGETKARLLQAIGSFYSHSDTAQILEPRDLEHQRTALVASRDSAGRGTIELLRAGAGRLARTVLRQLTMNPLATRRHQLTEVVDHNNRPSVGRALVDTNFLPAGTIWYKPCLNYVGSGSGVLPPLQAMLAGVDNADDVQDLVKRAINAG